MTEPKGKAKRVDVKELLARGRSIPISTGVRSNTEHRAFGVVWPLRVRVISERDLGWPAFKPPESLVAVASEPCTRCRE